MSEIRAYVDSDRAFVVWRLDAAIDDCRGFALQRKSASSGAETTLDTWVGFAGDVAPGGTRRPSTEWPIQRFMWSDYDPPREAVAYRAVPMVGAKDALQTAEDKATDWSEPVSLGADPGDGLSAYFNRGIVASQWLSRELRARGGETRANLTTAIQTPGDRVRNFLGGAVLWRLRKLLAEATSSGATVYAALFELNDPELVSLLQAFGDKAHVLLANGTKQSDENAAARAALRGSGVEVHDRMVTVSTHFAHNKFLVIEDGQGPAAVWTGSTNWTITGLCTQSNNAVLAEDRAIASWYRSEWDALVAAGNDYPDKLVSDNSVAQSSPLAHGGAAWVWFAPVAEGIDLAAARQLINAATKGVLFLMFNPGPQGTLLNDIVARTDTQSASYDSELHIHGVLNQDPSTTAHPIIGLFHRGALTEADIDVVLPAAVDSDFAFWVDELNYSLVMVHSKCIVIDPFSDSCAVITGSHNMGPKASAENDDNLLIITGQRGLAEAYAVYIMGVYNQYRWRYHQREAAKGSAPATAAADDAAPTWAGLVDDASWQTPYFSPGPEQRELSFWLPAST